MRNHKRVCPNFGSCSSAGKPIVGPQHSTASCPECGGALVSVGGGKPWQVALAVFAIFLIGGAVIYLGIHLRARFLPKQTTPPATAQGKLIATSPQGFFQDPNAKALLNAAFEGDAKAVRAMVLRQPDLLRIKGKDGVTPLHVALLSRSPEAFGILLEAGFDPDARLANGLSPFLAAACLPEPGFAALVLKRRPDLLGSCDSHGRTALHLATGNRQPATLRMLLQAGADPNATDADGGTPLIHAFQGRLPVREVVDLLVQAGAKPSTKDAYGFSAKDYARTFKDPSLAALAP